MGSWLVNYTIGQPINEFPMALFQDIGPVQMNFQLSSSQIGARTLTIATTYAFAGGRPKVTVNDWEGPLFGLPEVPYGRGITRGTYRGFVSCMFSGSKSYALSVTQNAEYVIGIREFSHFGTSCQC